MVSTVGIMGYHMGFRTGQVSVGTTATVLGSVTSYNYGEIGVRPISAGSVYIGSSNVTTSNGIPLTLTNNPDGFRVRTPTRLFGRALSGTVIMAYEVGFD